MIASNFKIHIKDLNNIFAWQPTGSGIRPIQYFRKARVFRTNLRKRYLQQKNRFAKCLRHANSAITNRPWTPQNRMSKTFNFI